MRRRDFIKGIVGSATAWPLAAPAQQSAMPVIGFLNGASPDGYAPMASAFRRGLKETGYVEGQNVAIEYRWADGQYGRLAGLAGELIHHPVSVIAATSTPANLVAKAATSSIPIVFTAGGDPVKLGLVTNLNRPGGNITGVTSLAEELIPKRLQLARELVPTTNVIGLLLNPKNPDAESLARESQAAAATLGVELNVLHASTEAELDEAFTTFRKTRAGVLVIGGDALFNSHAKQLAALTIRYSVPAIFQYSEFTAAGGLIGYSSSLADNYRLAGGYVGRILKGEKPGDLPVQESTKVELIINQKTAKSLGITVPQSLLSRADEVIE